MTVAVVTVEEFDVVRAEVAALREEVAALKRERVRVEKPPAEWMSPAAFAKRVGLSPRKIAELIAAGMPSRKIGRARRVDVVAADVWIKERGGA